jgi:hypothetical protein
MKIFGGNNSSKTRKISLKINIIGKNSVQEKKKYFENDYFFNTNINTKFAAH